MCLWGNVVCVHFVLDAYSYDLSIIHENADSYVYINNERYKSSQLKSIPWFNKIISKDDRKYIDFIDISKVIDGASDFILNIDYKHIECMNPSILYFFIKCVDSKELPLVPMYYWFHVTTKYLELMLECEEFLFKDDDNTDDIIKVDMLLTFLHRYLIVRDDLLLYCKDVINTISTKQSNCKLRLAVSAIIAYDGFDQAGKNHAWQKARSRYKMIKYMLGMYSIIA